VVALSRDGSRLYHGRQQMSPAGTGKNLEVFPEPIVAATRDVAFGSKAYYRATTGSKLGEYGFPTARTELKFDLKDAGAGVVAVSPDGLSVWVVDREKKVAHHYALEGDK
jgi:hypothetical protein